MSNNSTKSAGEAASEARPSKAMMYGDELERMLYLLTSLGVPLENIDRYTDPVKAKNALISGKYDALLLDTTRTFPEIIDIHHLSMMGKVATITLSLTRQVLPAYMVQQWKTARNGLFHYTTNQYDRFTGVFICLISAPASITWTNMGKAEIARVTQELKNKNSQIIFIQGEAGSGKYSIAQYAHAKSLFPRRGPSGFRGTAYSCRGAQGCSQAQKLQHEGPIPLQREGYMCFVGRRSSE